MTGFLASSKAGHDKDKIYVIIKEDTEYVWLADGRIKTVEQPKKKRKKHITKNMMNYIRTAKNRFMQKGTKYIPALI